MQAYRSISWQRQALWVNQPTLEAIARRPGAAIRFHSKSVESRAKAWPTAVAPRTERRTQPCASRRAFELARVEPRRRIACRTACVEPRMSNRVCRTACAEARDVPNRVEASRRLTLLSMHRDSALVKRFMCTPAAVKSYWFSNTTTSAGVYVAPFVGCVSRLNAARMVWSSACRGARGREGGGCTR